MKRDSAISYYFKQKDILSLLIFSKGTTVSRDLLKLSIALYRKRKREGLKDGNETCYYVCHGKGGTDKKNGGAELESANVMFFLTPQIKLQVLSRIPFKYFRK